MHEMAVPLTYPRALIPMGSNGLLPASRYAEVTGVLLNE